MHTPTVRIAVACELAESIARDPDLDLAEFLQRRSLPATCHAWAEIQTVLSAARTGKPVLPTARPAPSRRVNMFEPETEDERAEFDVADYSYAEVHLTRRIREAYGHQELALRILSGCAVRHGDYRPGRGDSHIVSYREHRFILSADGRTVIDYQHREPDPGRSQRRAGQAGSSGVTDERFDREHFDPLTVEIRARVLENFSNKHGTDHEEAEAEIRDFLEWALGKGKVRTAANGCGLFEYRGYRVWVAPDGRTVTKYQTNHIERTPRDVRDKVPSRFGRHEPRQPSQRPPVNP